jgi:hypothetical protein
MGTYMAEVMPIVITEIQAAAEKAQMEQAQPK